ncbi:hypothetical protein MA16_Dca003789 [Dendrobium catenatum]|uniref:Uncharacterized protein n=1 Tax=Dendrobium catenatum TaxID=906689 RepID=A0A2I0WFY6_9ASPA|nr:hypothetical protein MA16_Dca003789 [Dendrobium catenatum]
MSEASQFAIWSPWDAARGRSTLGVEVERMIDVKQEMNVEKNKILKRGSTTVIMACI